jgi:molybdopterin converting factor small subunit
MRCIAMTLSEDAMGESDNGTSKSDRLKLNISIGTNLGSRNKRQHTLEITEGATALDVIEELIQRSLIKFKEDKEEHEVEKLFKNIMILVNGKNIRYLDGMNTAVSENDKIVILKAMIGG